MDKKMLELFMWIKGLFVANIRKGSRVKVKGPSEINFFGTVIKKKNNRFWVETDDGILLIVNKDKLTKEGRRRG